MPKNKNIVVFSDGTGNEGGKGHNSNVYKLFNMVEDRTPQQIAFYDRGVGTGWRKITGNGAGMGISKNIRDCYQFIFENYTVGDRIYLFGFSRGATTVRSLSGFIHLFGILPKSRPELIKKAYKIYKIRDVSRREAKAKEFVEKHNTMWVRIQFLGVWDTVAALGIPIQWIDVIVDRIPFWRHKFHNLQLSRSVENACHALSIDDERKTFHPVLWDHGIDTEYQTMQQVWFSGMHSDVGGGYAEHELSDITLEWMIEKAVANGLLIYKDHKVKIAPNPDGFIHDSRGKGLARWYRKQERTWNPGTHGKPVIHKSVQERRLNTKNEEMPPYTPWIFGLDHEVEG